MKDFKGKRAVALGSFDGLHSGHIEVIKKAAESGYAPTVFCINKLLPAKRLLSDSLKKKYMLNAGACEIIEQSLDDIRDMSPEQFVMDILKERLNTAFAVCGFNYRFGKNGASDAIELKRLCEKYGIECEICPPVVQSGITVSSTAIRRYIENGEIEAANGMLGYNYTVDFAVASGRQIGRTIGVPTINQILPSNFVSPRRGVYASYVTLKGVRYAGVTNFGVKPTIEEKDAPMYETWIAGFSGSLYGKNVETSLLRFIRDEKKFRNLDELKGQIICDAKISREIFDENARAERVLY